MFNHKNYNAIFVSNPGMSYAANYGVRVTPVVTEQMYYRCIGVHHLKPEENVGKQNIYIEVLDKNGARVPRPFMFAGWTWEGKRPEEKADPILLDKPDSEPAGNIGVYWGQKVSLWIIGRNLSQPALSDKVENLHTMHPDEGPGNTLGHHSFYVVFQETTKSTPLPPDPNPVPPTDWKKAFDERQLKEIEFCRLYTKNFNHGTVGHNEKIIIAKLADLLDS